MSGKAKQLMRAKYSDIIEMFKNKIKYEKEKLRTIVINEINECKYVLESMSNVNHNSKNDIVEWINNCEKEGFVICYLNNIKEEKYNQLNTYQEI